MWLRIPRAARWTLAVLAALAIAAPLLACSRKTKRRVKTIGIECVAVLPSWGPLTGGTIVTITGEGFDGGAIVLFGEAEATGVAVTNKGREIVCVTPPGGPGAVDVVVWNPNGAGCRRIDGFTYTTSSSCPGILAVNPDMGPDVGGTPVRIDGSSFTAPAIVFFGSTEATNVSVISAVEIRCMTPPGSGTVDVTVENPGGCMAVLPAAFTYISTAPCPAVTAVAPTTGPESGGTPVAITGDSFIAPVTVRFGAALATGVDVVSTTEVRCLTPPGMGTVDVTVENWGGCATTLPAAFAYYGLPVTGCTPCFTVEPREVSPGGGDLVRIGCDCGIDFDDTTAVLINGVAIAYTLVSSCEIELSSPSLAPGEHDIEICGRWGCHTFSGALIVTDCPAGTMWVHGSTPTSGTRGGGETMTIDGCGFPVPGIVIVRFGGKPSTNVVVVDDTTIFAVVPSSACAGVVDVSVDDLAGQLRALTRSYTYDDLPTDPRLDSVTPAIGPAAGGDVVSLFGSNFDPASVVYFGSQQTSIQSITASQIDVTTPNVAGPGRADVIVEDSNGCQAVLWCGYEYTP